jgi:hypothetical protein
VGGDRAPCDDAVGNALEYEIEVDRLDDARRAHAEARHRRFANERPAGAGVSQEIGDVNAEIAHGFVRGRTGCPEEFDWLGLRQRELEPRRPKNRGPDTPG